MLLKIFNKNTIEKTAKIIGNTVKEAKKSEQVGELLNDTLAKFTPEARKAAEEALYSSGARISNVGHGIFTIEKPCYFDSSGITTSFYDLQTGKWLKNKHIIKRTQIYGSTDGVGYKKDLPFMEIYRKDVLAAPESYKKMYNFNPEYNEYENKSIHQLRCYDANGLTYYHRKVNYGDRWREYGGSRIEPVSSHVYDIKNKKYHKSIESSYYGCGPLGSAHESGTLSLTGESGNKWRGFVLHPEHRGFVTEELGYVDSLKKV